MNIENNLKSAVIPGLIALNAALLSHWVSLSVIGIIGFGSVVVVTGIGALEYGISFKKLFRR